MKIFVISIYIILNITLLYADSDIDKLYRDVNALNREYSACMKSLTEVEYLSTTKNIRMLQNEIERLSYELSRQKLTIEKLKTALKDSSSKLQHSEFSFFPATTFKTIKTVHIYDAINGKVVQTWLKNSAFTSQQKSRYWIKVSGYFDPSYVSATSDMWIKREEVKLHEREKE
jgi:predicted RNase H-like nuclease (RuvC/YqgF family)